MTTVAVIDFETTGTDPVVDRVVELGVVVLKLEGSGWTAVDGSQRLFHPGDRGVPPEASAVHHLTLRDLEGRPEFTREQWYNAVPSSDYVVAHNSSFDYGFVAIAPAGKVFAYDPESRPWICTLKCARVAWPDAPAYGNQVLRYWLDLDVKLPSGLAPHRALYDAAVTAQVFVKLWRAFNGDLERMVKVSSEPSLLRKVTFGKHAGKLWQDLPRDYLEWVLTKDFDADTVWTARHCLDSKK